MKFIDEAIITVSSGKGGNGIISFRREKYVPRGGPDGGDGGDGGDVVLIGDDTINTLAKFQFQRIFQAENGKAGEGKNKTGASGKNLTIQVPLGTEIFDTATNEKIGEILHLNETVLVAHRGTGGLGNTRFKTSINQAPRQATKGKDGEQRELNLQLSVLADVGLLGLPNAGKSSLLRKATAAKVKVADYPFTTLEPALGVVIPYPGSGFIMADIPGIIEESHLGKGLGLQFLRHVSRTKMLLHVIDGLPIDGSTPVENLQTINNEVRLFNRLASQEQWIVINKIDLLDEQQQQDLVQNITEYFQSNDQEVPPIFLISALSGEGLAKLIHELAQRIIPID